MISSLPVAVQIGERHAHALAQMRADAGLPAHIPECPVALIPVQRIRQRFVVLRMAIGPVARLPVSAIGLRGRVPFHIIHDKQIEKSICVIIKPARRHRPRRRLDARLGGPVFEGPVSPVPVERVAMPPRHEQVRAPVVVVVARRRPHVEPASGKPCFFSHILPLPAAQIAVQPVAPLRRVLLQRWLRRPVRQEQIQPPVAVVIEQRHAAGHRFNLVALRRGGVAENGSFRRRKSLKKRNLEGKDET